MSSYLRHSLGMGLLAILAIGGLSFAQTSAPTNSLPNPYRSIENWGTLPEGRTWGSTSAVAIDPDGTSVWVGPSGVYIDGKDNIYVADSESESVSKNHDGWKRGIRIGSAKDGLVTAF